MKEIKLSQGKVALVDDEDYEWLNQWKWSAYKSPKSNTYYAERNEYINSKKSKRIRMHRLILGLTDPKLNASPKDHNGLNCQRSNLRIGTVTQICRHASSHKDSTSKYLGVSWSKERNKWAVSIHLPNKISKGLGRYENEIDAAKAYDEAAKIYFGEFANLNFK